MPSLLSIPNFLAPAAAQYETFPRAGSPNTAVTTARTSQILYLSAIWLPVGASVSTINYLIGSTGTTTATHWWFGLYDNTRNQLAVTADQLTATITASAVTSLAVASVSAGPATTFITTYTGPHYIGKMVAASVMPTSFTDVVSLTLAQLPPILGGSSDAVQTTPPAFPHQATGVSASSNRDYGYV